MSFTSSSIDRARYQHVDQSAENIGISANFYEQGLQTAGIHFASIDEKKRLWWKNALITAGCIASWFFFATLLSVYNKWMFDPNRFGFPYPFFVTCLHMWIQFLLAALVRYLWPRRFRPPERPNIRQYTIKIVPTALATAADIGLSNRSLQTITLTFYTMVKNSSLIFVLLFAFLFRLEIFSLRLVGVIFLILVGEVLMVATETEFSLTGFILVISASASGGLRWSLTQLLLKRNKKTGENLGLDTPPAALFWMTPAMGVSLAILSMIVHGLDIFRNKFFDGFSSSFWTCVYILFPGAIAFCMVISEFYILKRAGVVPMSIAGIFKEVATMSASALVFGDELTPLNVTGIAIAFCGIVLFTYHKYSKSLESTVPVDTHGNPVEEDDIDIVEEYTPGAFGLEESQTFNGGSREITLDSARSPLFAIGPEDDSDNDDESRTLVSNSGNGHSVNVDVEDSKPHR